MSTLPASNRLGATLIETLISVAVFSVLTGCVFVIFNIGNTNWNVSILRHDLQSGGRRASNVLERDLRSTDAKSIFDPVTGGSSCDTATSINPVGWGWGGGTIRRNTIGMVALDSWSNPNNFDSGNGLPIWNEYIFYVATIQQNQGGLGQLGGTFDGALYRIVFRFDSNGTPNPLDRWSGTTYLPENWSPGNPSTPGTIVNVVNSDASKGTVVMQRDLEALAAPSPAPGSYQWVRVQNVGSIFAFSVDPVSTPGVVGITLKDRKRSDRDEAVSSGIESFQINMKIAPLARTWQ